jgi:hypothetical protein
MFHGEKRYSDPLAITKNGKLATHLATRNFPKWVAQMKNAAN